MADGALGTPLLERTNHNDIDDMPVNELSHAHAGSSDASQAGMLENDDRGVAGPIPLRPASVSIAAVPPFRHPSSTASFVAARESNHNFLMPAHHQIPGEFDAGELSAPPQPEFSPDTLEDVLGPWVRVGPYFGLYLHASGDQSHWLEVAHGILVASVISGVAGYLISIDPIAPSKVINTFFFVLPISYAICAHLLRTGGLHRATSILFDSHTPCCVEYASASSVSPPLNPLMEQVRLGIAMKCRTYYPVAFAAVCLVTISLELYFNLTIHHVDLFDIISSCVIAPYMLIAIVMSLLVVPFVSAVHAAAAHRLTDVLIDDSSQQQWIAQLSTGYVSAGKCLDSDTVRVIDAGFATSKLPTDGAPASTLVMHHFDLFEHALDVIDSHRKALDSTSSTFTALVAFTFVSTAIIYIVLICSYLATTRHGTFDGMHDASFVFWSSFFFTLIVLYLATCVRISVAHSGVLLELRRHGTRRLLSTLSKHAWRLQLLVSTPEDDYFRVGNLSVTVPLVLSVSSVLASVISYIASSALTQ
jgi:hypothetical protein